MYEDYDKLTLEEQKRLLREIDQSYDTAMKEIAKKLREIIEADRKSNKQTMEAVAVILAALWVGVGAKVLSTSESIMANTWIFYEYASTKLGNPLILPMKEISGMIGKTIKKRKKIIRWDQVIRGNSRKLDKAVAKIVKDGIKNSKTTRQIQDQLEKQMGLNRGKAKAIARTETNYYKSEAKLQVGIRQEKAGNPIIKTWVYTYLSKEPRPEHQLANGQTVEGINGLFSIGGYQTTGPHHFGVASQDINCMCDMRVEFARDVDTTLKEYQAYKGDKK